MSDTEKSLLVVNMTGDRIEAKDWLDDPTRKMVLSTAEIIGRHTQNDVVVSWTHDGVYMIDYAYNGQVCPTVRIEGARTRFPKGTPEAILWAILGMGK